MEELTGRQIDILSFLLSRGDWVTSEELSEYLTLNKKTIQQEMKKILMILDDECQLEVQNRKGYFLKYLSDAARRVIVEKVRNHEMYYSMSVRSSMFLLYLAFQKDYVTMQGIADTFYFSKGAVALEIENVHRWAERCEGVILDISNQRGVRLIAREDRLRVFCSHFTTRQILKQAQLEEKIVDDYAAWYQIVEDVLKDVILRYHYVISGDELTRNTNLLPLVWSEQDTAIRRSDDRSSR